MSNLDNIYNNSTYQDYRWKDIIHWSTDFIASLSEIDIKVFHYTKMAQLSVTQKMAFTDAQKSHMNADQLAAITVKSL